MRRSPLRPRQNENSGLSRGAVVGIAVGVAVLVVVTAAVALFMFYLRQKRTKGRKHQSAIDESVAMSAFMPPALDSQFAGRDYGSGMSPIMHSPFTPTSPHSQALRSPQRPDREESRVWADWLVQTAPKPSKPAIQTNFIPEPDSPWLESEPSALLGRGSRITDVGCEDMRSPIELELAHDAAFSPPRSYVRATSGPLPGPSAMPASPPAASRSSLHPQIISIRRKPIIRLDTFANQPRISNPTFSNMTFSNPTISNPTISDPTISNPTTPASASPRSPSSNAASNTPSSRPPSLPLPDFNAASSPDELFIPPISPLGPIFEITSPIDAPREEDEPVLLARERVEMLRQERERLERIHELRKMEEQAKRDLLEAQRSSLESRRSSAEGKRKETGGEKKSGEKKKW